MGRKKTFKTQWKEWTEGQISRSETLPIQFKECDEIIDHMHKEHGLEPDQTHRDLTNQCVSVIYRMSKDVDGKDLWLQAHLYFKGEYEWFGMTDINKPRGTDKPIESFEKVKKEMFKFAKENL